MSHENLDLGTPSNDQPERKARKIGRRALIKSGVATVAGLTLGTSYVKPQVISVLVQEASASSISPASLSASSTGTPTPTGDKSTGQNAPERLSQGSLRSIDRPERGQGSPTPERDTVVPPQGTPAPLRSGSAQTPSKPAPGKGSSGPSTSSLGPPTSSSAPSKSGRQP